MMQNDTAKQHEHPYNKFGVDIMSCHLITIQQRKFIRETRYSTKNEIVAICETKTYT